MASAVASTSAHVFPSPPSRPVRLASSTPARSIRRQLSPNSDTDADSDPGEDAYEPPASATDDDDDDDDELVDVKDEPLSEGELDLSIDAPDLDSDDDDDDDEEEDVKPRRRRRERNLRCSFPDCDKVYDRQCRLEEHERTHTGERPFVCSECDATFTRETHLAAHLRSHQSDSEKPYVCQEDGCDKAFWTNQHLKKHVEIAHKGKTYDCTQCDSKFRKHHQLRAHFAQVHCTPGTKPFLCDHPGCDRSFSQKVHQQAHAKTHDPSRYVCLHPDCASLPLASRQFSVWSNLQKHTKQAHPPRCPYPVCNNKTFTTQRGLKNHLLIHEREEAKGEEGKDFSDPKKRSSVKRKRSERRRKREKREAEIARLEKELEAGKKGGDPVDAETNGTGAVEDVDEEGSDWEERQESERDERMREDFRIGGKKKRRVYEDLSGLASTKPSVDIPLPAPFDDPPPAHRPRPFVDVPPPRPTSKYLDLVTGTNYASSAALTIDAQGRKRLSRKFPCPFPAILALPFNDVKPSSRRMGSDRPLSPTLVQPEWRRTASSPSKGEKRKRTSEQDEEADEGEDVTGGGERRERDDENEDAEGTCKFWYKRVYDIERHLRSRHGVEMVGGRETLEKWFEDDEGF